MKITVVSDQVFVDLGGGYILYLCSYEDYRKLSISQLKELVGIRLREKQNE